MRLRKMLLGIALLAAGISAAQGQKEPESYELDVAGEIGITPDGTVFDYQLRSKLTPEVAAMVDRAVRQWRFEPVLVGGTAVPAKSSLRMLLKAEPVPSNEEQYVLRIAQVHFGDPGHPQHMMPPKYPKDAIVAHAGARVMLAIRLDEKGNVVEAQPYQTSLDVRTHSEQEAEKYRKLFERASMEAARYWQYDPAETINGKPVGTSAMVPIVFTLSPCRGGCTAGNREARWRAYIPGPMHPAPWMQEKVADNADLSSLEDGQAAALDSRLHLKDNQVGKTL